MQAEQTLELKDAAANKPHAQTPRSNISLDSLLEKNLLPDWLIRIGIRRLLRERLREENKGNAHSQQAHLLKLIEELKQSPIAVETVTANTQHYEVPTRFYQLCLGKRLKYSGAFWPAGVNILSVRQLRALGGQLQHCFLGGVQSIHTSRPKCAAVFQTLAEAKLIKPRRHFVMLRVGGDGLDSNRTLLQFFNQL